MYFLYSFMSWSYVFTHIWISLFYIHIYASNSSELSLFLFVKVGQLYLQQIANQLNFWFAQLQDMTHHNTYFYKDLQRKKFATVLTRVFCMKIFPKKKQCFSISMRQIVCRDFKLNNENSWDSILEFLFCKNEQFICNVRRVLTFPFWIMK